MDFRKGRLPKSLMPCGYIAFWSYLRRFFHRSVIIAGSFASAQQQQNVFGKSHSFNDIDGWCIDEIEEPLIEKNFIQLVGEHTAIFIVTCIQLRMTLLILFAMFFRII